MAETQEGKQDTARGRVLTAVYDWLRDPSDANWGRVEERAVAYREATGWNERAERQAREALRAELRPRDAGMAERP